jgi:hypothetical protein
MRSEKAKLGGEERRDFAEEGKQYGEREITYY